jgi:hypothetical protein
MGLVKNCFNNYVPEYNSIFRLKVNKDIKTVIKTFKTITNFICKWFLILYESSWTVDDEDNDEYLCRDFFCRLHFSLAVIIPDIYIYNRVHWSVSRTFFHVYLNIWFEKIFKLLHIKYCTSKTYIHCIFASSLLLFVRFGRGSSFL